LSLSVTFTLVSVAITLLTNIRQGLRWLSMTHARTHTHIQFYGLEPTI
jgi:hypothetical protein